MKVKANLAAQVITILYIGSNKDYSFKELCQIHSEKIHDAIAALEALNASKFDIIAPNMFKPHRHASIIAYMVQEDERYVETAASRVAEMMGLADDNLIVEIEE